MAQAPSKGLKFTREGKHHVFGVLDNGDSIVVVLAIEKAPSSGDYRWATQVDIDYLNIRHGGDVSDFMVSVVSEANEVLDKLYGKVTTPVTDEEKVQAYIMGELAYNQSTNKIHTK